MKRLLIAILLTSPVWATFPTAYVGEIRSTTGNDLNSGIFTTTGGSPTCSTGGTDYSQQDSPQVTFDGATITATTSGTSTTITITGYTVATTDKCNSLRIASGTNFTAGLYYIVSVNTGANTWTLDVAVSSGAGSAMVGRMGGAIQTFGRANLDAVLVNTTGGLYWWKAGTSEVLTATITEGQYNGITFRGYDATRGDNTGTRPVLTSATNSVVLFQKLASFQSSKNTFNNVKFTHTAATRGICIRGAAAAGRSLSIINSVFDGCSVAIRGDGCNESGIRLTVIDSEIKNSTSHGVQNTDFTYMVNTYIHDNAGHGYFDDGTCTGGNGQFVVNGTVFDTNGACGIRSTGSSTVSGRTVQNSVFYNNTNNGLLVASADQGGGATVINSIFEANGAAGGGNCCGVANGDSNGNTFYFLNNAFYNNNTAPTFSLYSTVDQSTNITLSTSPFTDAPNGVFTLNSTAGGGAALKGVGFPGVSPFGTGSLDVGALQSSGGGGSTSANSSYVN